MLLADNSDWWKRLDGNLRRTRRGVTASLVAQTFFAAIAYIFTVIASFDSELGDPTTALQIASGSLWVWLVSQIFGIIQLLIDELAGSCYLGMDNSGYSVSCKLDRGRAGG